MFKATIMIVIVFTLSMAISAHSQELWTSKDGSIRNIDTRAVFASGEKVYLATKKELYESDGRKNKWESIFFIPSGDNEISCIGGGLGNLFIGTRRGLFRSSDNGRTWRNVFRTIIPDRSDIIAVEMAPGAGGKIVIGTRSGLFISDDGGARWRNISGALKGRRVKCITFGSHSIYAGANDGLYAAKDGTYSWERVFVYTDSADKEEVSEVQDDLVEIEKAEDSGINCIMLKGRKIYIAFGRKISYSDDIAKGWQSFSAAGLRGAINDILISGKSDKLYCATTKGVFEYMADKRIWRELPKGLDKVVNVKKILFQNADEKALWVSTDKGLYRLEVVSIAENQYVDVERNLNTMKVIINGEPTFKELQAQAMRFNDVNPEKIKRWHAESRMRALVPKVNIGFDNARSNSYEIYTSATKDYVVSGPDDVNEGMDVSISWDLANLIWSDDQTNIDVRSRLTTQLRNDILDDLRRAYFERRRLQYELMASPPADMKLRFEKELRIQELTQAIDDITGNYLSENMRDKNKNDK